MNSGVSEQFTNMNAKTADAIYCTGLQEIYITPRFICDNGNAQKQNKN